MPTAPLSELCRRALQMARRKPRRLHRTQPAGAQEPAHLRILCGAARSVSRAGLRRATCARWCSPAPAAISAPAATCTKSSGRLTRMTMPELLDFTRMTGDLVRAIRGCPQIVVAAVDGVCAGAGAIIAMARDIRLATPAARTAFLFTRVGLAGCDMGACAILPRIIGQGRAAELLFTGRAMTAEEGLAWGFFSRWSRPTSSMAAAEIAGRAMRSGPGVRALR